MEYEKLCIKMAFSLAEMMVVLLIVSIIMAAVVPIISKRVTSATATKNTGGGVPIGTVITWPSATAPSDNGIWLECNGNQINTKYTKLISLVGANTPNYSGMFLRGVGSQAATTPSGSTINSGNPVLTTYKSGTLGKIQGDTIRNIKGTVHTEARLTPSGVFQAVWGGDGGYNGAGPTPDSFSFDASLVVPVDPTYPENRPVNIAVRYFIKADN